MKKLIKPLHSWNISLELYTPFLLLIVRASEITAMEEEEEEEEVEEVVEEEVPYLTGVGNSMYFINY